MGEEKPRRPELLIERHLPVAEIGVECQREGSTGLHPPVNRLHVWWARRPLIACRAAILASLLPADTKDDWFLKLLGIHGDPVEAKARIAKARAGLIELPAGSPYGYDRAFKYTPDDAQLKKLFGKIEEVWGDGPIRMLDPMAGGGSIPFEAMRYGLETYANELNPVAYVILKATAEYPPRFGKKLIPDLKEYAGMVHQLAREKLAAFYPSNDSARVLDYVWARTVRCPECGLVVPLSPNWWLQKGDKPVGVRVVAPHAGKGPSSPAASDGRRGDAGMCAFELLVGKKAVAGADPDEGTVSRGTGKCPRCLSVVEGDHIKAEAQAGRMGQQMYAVVLKTGPGREFRLPTPEDLAAVEAAEVALKKNIIRWTAQGLVPDEAIPGGTKQDEAIRYGFKEWKDLFAPRQLLAHLTYLEAIQQVKADLFRNEDEDRARAIVVYLFCMLSKCLNYSSRMSVWHPTRSSMANTFDRHDFSFKWTHGEMNPADPKMGAWVWAADQVTDAYEGLADLASPASDLFTAQRQPKIHITQGNAADLREIPDGSIHLICVDPPYYDNVMYAELSDFFYVWQKRTLGDVFPEAFARELTDKDAEAVANPARFKGLDGGNGKTRGRGDAGKRLSPKEMAEQDYETKMRNCFERMHEVLRPDGVMTVMFTHKRVEAWDTLAAALIGAGFSIDASWPIHTESEHSLHQARKNAAASTILLVCRKRPDGGEGAWWEDIEPDLQQAVREHAAQYEKQGITGVDLYISTFGPALRVISEHWPVRDRSGKEIRPDVALDAARTVVTDYRYKNLLHTHSASLPVDEVTRWMILAWDIYQAEQFPFDEARKLAIAVGVDMDALRGRHRLIGKKGKYVTLVEPSKRQRRGHVDPEAESFDCTVDAIHTAAVIMKEDGGAGVRRFFGRTGLHKNEQFVAAVEAYVSALPEAVAHPSIPEKQRRDEWYIRELAQTMLSGQVEIPEYGQMELWE